MLFNIIIVGVVNVLDHSVKFIRALQQYIDYFGGRNKFTAAHKAQHILHGMGKILNDRKSHKSSATLNGMGRTEHLIDEILIDIFAPFFNFKKVVFDVGQMFK